MKKVFIYILVSLGIFSFKSADNVIASLKTGNANSLSVFFDNTVEIEYLDQSMTLNKQKASELVNSIFVNHPVKNFEVLHQSNNTGSQFFIGNLITKNGTFRTTIYIKKSSEKCLIQEIVFEKK